MLNINDRVSRQIEIGKPERRYGIIISKYKTKQSFETIPINVFDIKWDDGEEGKGYFEVSLQKEK